MSVAESASVSATTVVRLPSSPEPIARKLWPDTFAGLWGHADGSENYSVAFTEEAAQHTSELGLAWSGNPDDPRLTPVEVTYSLAFLERLSLRIVKHRDQASLGKRKLPGTNGGRFDLSVDVIANRVEVIIPRPSARTHRTFARYGPAVVVRRGGLVHPLPG
jgi:hypothetical protein